MAEAGVDNTGGGSGTQLAGLPSSFNAKLNQLIASAGQPQTAPGQGVVWLGDYNYAENAPGAPSNRSLGEEPAPSGPGRTMDYETPNVSQSVPGRNAFGGQSFHTERDMLTVDQAMQQPYTWDQDKIESTMTQMQDAGFDVDSFEDMVDLWGQLVDRAAKTYAATDGEDVITPWDVLDLSAAENKKAAKQKGEQYPKTRTSVNTSAYTVTPDAAWSAMYNAARNMLGRAPTDDEVNELLSKATYQAQQNPTVTTTKQTTDENGNVHSTRSTDEGYSDADLQRQALEAAQEAPDYGAYQASSTYFNALLGALGPVA